METLSLGKHNPRLVDVRKALDHGALTRDGFLPVEGPKLLEEARKSGLEVAAIFKRRGVETPAGAGETSVYELEAGVFKTIQSTETSQGVIALVRPRRYNLPDILSSANPLVVVLARLQDPGNAGTVLRVAESFGADGCVATVGTAGALNSKTVRASAGSIFRLPHVWDMDARQAFAALKASNVRIAGTSPSAAQTIGEWDWRGPSAVVIGNEGAGLSEEELAMCDTALRIPHSAAVDSLNSAIAAAVVLYEAWRQRVER